MKGLVQDKVAVITGAGSGVGRAAALLFTRHGARVIAADIDPRRADETVAMIAAEGGEARAMRCDVADEADVERMIQSAIDAFGRIDILYNNAGITVMAAPGSGPKRLVETTAAELAMVQSVNINGVLFGCKAAIAAFERQGGGGSIVNTASVAGLIGYGGVAYGATKGAVVGLTRTLAMEVAAQGIRINSVCPAGMPTRYSGMDPDGPNGDRMRASMGAAHPLGRPIDPMDCASAALFLASDLASNITGVNLPVDGGLSAGIPLRR
jgi:NAD(P)-dependent dehydrogenase (short-subunit alcohol dehydrogenase family)